MLKTDAEKHQQDAFSDTVRNINLDVILEIQKDIDFDDMISLVFLLYKVPDTALQRLIVFQRVSTESNMNLLYDWALSVQSHPTWRYEFLEALTICRQYHIIRKLGFNVLNVKEHYLPRNVNVCIYVDPMKKGLYKLCENIDSNNLSRLKKTLLTYEIDTTEYEACEMVFLDLMCQKFITLSQNTSKKLQSNSKCQIERLVKIIENISGLKTIASEIRSIEHSINSLSSILSPGISNTPIASDPVQDESKARFNEDFLDVYKLLNELQDEDVTVLHLKSDTTNLIKEIYPIKNTKRIGVCCIINQEEFHPSKESIEGNSQMQVLDNRLGSTIDQLTLENTMKSFHFKVRSCRNVDHREMFKFIKDVIQNDFCPDDSIFVLCILSHGIRGHVYAADSVKVKVEDIQNLLDSDVSMKLHGIPKILILQACQVNEHKAQLKLVADAPISTYSLRKLDFLIYWATAPEYEAYRDEQKGSIFIQSLCYMIKKKATQEHLYDIFTRVTDSVSRICNKLKCVQIPIFESTLRRKLYLQIPSNHNHSKA